MSEVRSWLQAIGLGQYADVFHANDLDMDLLRQVDDQILKDIGVSSAGHRLRIRNAIAKLGPEATHGKEGAATGAIIANVEVRQPTLSTAAGATPVSAAAEVAGERRYLTVMFCDLVGSPPRRHLSPISIAFRGPVAMSLARSSRCSLSAPSTERAHRRCRPARAPLTLLCRRCRPLSPSSLPSVSFAARVQALAEPGAVLVTAQVQRQVAGLFVAEERGTHNLKGIPEPTMLFRLVRASGGGRRSGQRQLTPLVGRDDEMAMLMRRWERARQGDGQLVLIVGEPGLGKSRLIEEFHSRLAETPHTWVEWSCSQLLQNTPLHPIAEWGRQRFGGADVPPARRLAELESSLLQVKLDPAENAPLLAPLLDIPLPPERAPSLAPEELRRRQLAALTSWVMAGAKAQPLVLAFEDLHWSDPTTLDVLRGIAERGALAPLLVVATARPEFRPPWSMRSHHGTISLAPLDRGQVQEMVAELSARHALPRAVVEDVAARTGGVPLFVEEVTRLLLERGEGGGGADSERTGQRWFNAESHRMRGNILLKRDPANTAPPEEAFLTAIAIAQQQKARGFELHAALSLAKLYQSTGRPADAHAVLAPALEGFSPTPEFPEIAEAQTLLATLPP